MPSHKINIDLEEIERFLFEKRGVDLRNYQRSIVEELIRQRITNLQCRDYRKFIEYLQEYPEEMDRLIDDLDINVSRFFRNSLTYEWIANIILPGIVLSKAKSAEHSLRIWSAGCSTGEEPYSIAMIINELEQGQKKTDLNIHVFGTDIDNDALEKAKQAVYSFESVKDIKYEMVKKYFSRKGERYSLLPEIKQRVRFSLFDMLDKKSYVPSESVFGNFDMVLCRNLLIYFSLDSQDEIFQKLLRSLSANGYLVLGEAEAPTEKFRSSFRKVNDCCPIYQKK